MQEQRDYPDENHVVSQAFATLFEPLNLTGFESLIVRLLILLCISIWEPIRNKAVAGPDDDLDSGP